MIDDLNSYEHSFLWAVYDHDMKMDTPWWTGEYHWDNRIMPNIGGLLSRGYIEAEKYIYPQHSTSHVFVRISSKGAFIAKMIGPPN